MLSVLPPFSLSLILPYFRPFFPLLSFLSALESPSYSFFVVVLLTCCVFHIFPSFLFVHVITDYSFLSSPSYLPHHRYSLLTLLRNKPIPFSPLLPSRPSREELLIRNTFPSRPHAHDCAAATGKLHSEDKRSE